MRTPDRAQVGSTRRDIRVDVVPATDRTHCDGRDADQIANAIGERGLVRAAVGRTSLGRGLARGHVEDVSAVISKRLRDNYRLFLCDAVRHPVGSGEPDADGPIGRPGSADCIEDLEREAKSVLGRPAVLIGALVADRGEEGGDQEAVREVQFQEIEAGSRRTPSRQGELRHHIVHVPTTHLARNLIALGPGDR